LVVDVIVPPSISPSPTHVKIARLVADAIKGKNSCRLLRFSRQVEQSRSPAIVVGEVNGELYLLNRILRKKQRVYYITCAGEPAGRLDWLKGATIVTPDEYSRRRLIKQGLRVRAKLPVGLSYVGSPKTYRTTKLGYANTSSLYNFPRHAVFTIRPLADDFLIITDSSNVYKGLLNTLEDIRAIPEERFDVFYDSIDFYVDLSESTDFPLFLLEAMSHGCVPIVPDKPHLNETIPKECRITIPIERVERMSEGWIRRERYVYSADALRISIKRALSMSDEEFFKLSRLCVEHVKKLRSSNYVKLLNFLEHEQERIFHFYGPYLDPSGYAEAARSYVLGLIKLGWRPILRRYDFTRGWHAPLEKETYNLFIRHETDESIAQGDLVFYCSTPNFWYIWSCGAKHIGWTLFECDEIHPIWVVKMNTVDGIITPSKFSENVFRKCNVKKRIDVVPIGINTSIFYPPTKEYRESELSTLKFITVGQYTSRKGFDVLLKAWFEAFKNVEDVSLTLYTFRSDVRESEFRAIEKEIEKARKGRKVPKVELKRPYLPQKVYAEILREHHVFVLPSRGEGFCIPAVEAQACGLLPIVTDGSSLPEVVSPDSVRSIKVEGTESCWGLSHVPWYNKHGDYDPKWLVPSLDSLIDNLKWCYENRDEVIARGLEASNYVSEKFEMNRVAKQLEKVLLYYVG